MKPLSEWTDEGLKTLETRYNERRLTEGGPFSLKEVMIERLRRKRCVFGVAETAKKIIELSRRSEDGVCSYGEIWSAFRPAEPWEGHKTQKIVTDALGAVVAYCVTNNLPVLSTLVVQKGKRQLTPKAVHNIYEECKKLGRDVGVNAHKFIEAEALRARALCASSLPSALASSTR
jgi:hypothetical protein